MATITPNLKLTLLEYGETDYAKTLNQNFKLIEDHDHKSGKIITLDIVKVTDNISFAKKFIYKDFSINSCKYFNFSLNTDSEPQSLYMVNGDLYYRDGYSREIQITADKSLVVNTIGYGFISGDMNASGAKIEYALASGYHFFSNTGNDFATIEFNELKCFRCFATDVDMQNLYTDTLAFTNRANVTSGEQVLKALTGDVQLYASPLNFPFTVSQVLDKIVNYIITTIDTYSAGNLLGLFCFRLITRSTSGNNINTYQCDSRQILGSINGSIFVKQQKLGGRDFDEFCLSSSYKRGVGEMCPVSNNVGIYFINSDEHIDINLISALNMVK